jgi:hypothetical protein
LHLPKIHTSSFHVIEERTYPFPSFKPLIPTVEIVDEEVPVVSAIQAIRLPTVQNPDARSDVTLDAMTESHFCPNRHGENKCLHLEIREARVEKSTLLRRFYDWKLGVPSSRTQNSPSRNRFIGCSSSRLTAVAL